MRHGDALTTVLGTLALTVVGCSAGSTNEVPENTVALDRSTYDREVERVASETVTMSFDIANYLKTVSIEDPRFIDGFSKQVLWRNLSEAVIINVSDDQIRSLALVNPSGRPLDRIITQEAIRGLADEPVVAVNSSDRVGALTKLAYRPNTYLYASRVFEPQLRRGK